MIDNKKKIIFYVDEDLHVQLRAALFYDRLGQSSFVRHMIEGYVANNKHLRDYMDEVLEKKLSTKKKKSRKKDREEEERVKNDFALDEEEIEDIFDIIGEEDDV